MQGGSGGCSSWQGYSSGIQRRLRCLWHGRLGAGAGIAAARGRRPEWGGVVAGVSAVNAAASLLGAPLMHDFAVISLSDWMTPWELIKKRAALAGEGDFVIALYNPKSKHRPDYIYEIQKILLEHRAATVPVGIVSSASREKESIVLSDLGHFTEENIGMFSMVIIGNSNTYVKDGYMITPRGYKITKE